jgi:hypothetical protein
VWRNETFLFGDFQFGKFAAGYFLVRMKDFVPVWREWSVEKIRDGKGRSRREA